MRFIRIRLIGSRHCDEKKFAETTYARWRDSPKGAVSAQELERKEAEYYTAIARLNAAESDVNADQGNVDPPTSAEAIS